MNFYQGSTFYTATVTSCLKILLVCMQSWIHTSNSTCIHSVSCTRYFSTD